MSYRPDQSFTASVAAAKAGCRTVAVDVILKPVLVAGVAAAVLPDAQGAVTSFLWNNYSQFAIAALPTASYGIIKAGFALDKLHRSLKR